LASQGEGGSRASTTGTSYKEIAKRMKVIQEQQKMIVQKMSKIKYKIGILSSKGGVGKSFVTATLAMALALKGRKVAVLDADIHGPSIPKMMGLPTGMGLLAKPDGSIVPAEGPLGIKVVSVGLMLPSDETPLIWRGPLKTSAIRELLAFTDWGELDYLLIDLPPGTGDEQLTIAQLIPRLTGFLLVTIPSDVSKVVVKKAAAFAKRLNVPLLGIIENMAYFECPDGSKHYIFGKGAAKEIAEEFGIPYLGEVPIDPRIREANDRGEVFFLKYGDSPTAKILSEITDKIIEIVESQERKG
jgi:ATP-binding protein involved in chromosome partitioning